MTRRSEPGSGSSPAAAGLIIIGGPTGSGKNRLALQLAAAHHHAAGVEIVNADSRQIYRGMRIGTNQPSDQELSAVPHHLFGFLEPSVEFNAADYERLAYPLVRRILEADRGRIAVVTGGTGFYIRALLKGVWPVPERNPKLRQRLRLIEQQKGRDHLHRILQRLDPESAASVPPNDVYRVARSIEIRLQSGRKRSELHGAALPDRFPALKVCVQPDRDELKKNIAERTEKMFREGWVEEVASLLEQHPGFARMPAARSLGYPEIIAHLSGTLGLADCKARIVEKTNQYAKRQLTWFRNQDGFQAVRPGEKLYEKFDSVLQLKR